MRSLFVRFITIFFVIPLCACTNQSSAFPDETMEPEASIVNSVTETSNATAIIPSLTCTLIPPETTPTPPLVLLPTLSTQDAEQKVLELLESNGGCELPGWWGATPGMSSWYDVKPFLLTIADGINGSSSFDLKKYYQSNILEVNIFKKSMSENSEEISVAYGVNSAGIIELIKTQGSATERKYQIHQILSQYGKPEEILLDVLPDSSEGIPVFWIVLLYPEYGFVAVYEGQPSIKNSSVIICPQNIAPELYLFSTEDLTLDLLQFMLKQISWIEPATISSIDTFPNLSIEFFYNELKTPDGCLSIDQ